MQTTGLNRSSMDKYYTSNDTVKKCIKLIKKHIDIGDDLCIEPSAGNGAFIDAIKTLTNNYEFYDLEPEHSEITTLDYLTYEHNDARKTHIIGNPPFGRQSSLAIKFIKKSAEFATSISFVLPKSFKKDSLKKHFPLNFHLVLEYDLPKDSFIVDNKCYDVPCVFQIWLKSEISREKVALLTPLGYKFVKKESNHDISFRRVGVNAGEIDTNTGDKSIQTHYFIKFNNLTDKIYDLLCDINYDCKNNTVGPKSISKQELIKEFNLVLQ
jgi:predicted RNA methylase